MASIQDILQGALGAAGNAVQGVGNFVNQDIVHPVESMFQPQQLQSPLPPAQTLPQAQTPATAQPGGIQGMLASLPQETTNALNLAQQILNEGKQDTQNAVQNVQKSVSDLVNNVQQSPITQGVENIGKNYVADALVAGQYTGYRGLQNALSSPQQRQQNMQDALQQAQKLNPQIASGAPGNLQVNPLQYIQAGLKGTGALLEPATTAISGLLNVPFSAATDVLQGKNPIQDVQQNWQKQIAQGVDFGAELGPLSKAAEPFVNPLVSRLSLGGASTNDIQTALKAGQVTADEASQLVKAGVTPLTKIASSAIEGFPGMAVMGGLQPAANTTQRLLNAASMGAQGALFNAGGTALTEGTNAVKNLLSQTNEEQALQEFSNRMVHLGEKGWQGFNDNIVAPFKKAFTISGKTQAELETALDSFKSLNPGNDYANQVLEDTTNEYLPQFKDKNTIEQANIWNYILSRKDGVFSQSEVPPELQPLDNEIFRVIGSSVRQSGKINFGATIGNEPKTEPEVPNTQLPEPSQPLGGVPESNPLPWESGKSGSDITVKPQAQIEAETRGEIPLGKTTSDLLQRQAGQQEGLQPEEINRTPTNQVEENTSVRKLLQQKQQATEESNIPTQDNASMKSIAQSAREKKVNEILKGTQNKMDNGMIVPTTPSDRENPIKITTPNATVRDARAAMDTAKTQIEQRGRVVQKLVDDAIKNSGAQETGGNATNKGANRLFRQAIEHPDMEKEILGQVKNPKEFKTALDQFRNFTNYNLEAAQAQGAQLHALPNYYSHQWDLSDPEKAAEYQALAQATAKNYKGWFNKPRVFKDIEEGEANGFQLKNKSVANDIADYTNAFSKEQGARVLSNELTRNFPDKATVVNGEGGPINTFQSRIPGTKGLYLTSDLHKQLADLEPPPQSSASKIITHINNADKEMRLSGGLFHVQNTGWDYLASNLGFGRFPRVLTAAKVFLSPGSYVDYMKDAINDGTIDKMAQANISFDTKQDFAGSDNFLQKTGKAIDKFNPLSQLNRATFSRLENFFKIESFRALDNRGLIDTSTPEGIKTAQGYGREINNMFGGQNRRVGDDIFNKSPQGRFIANNLLALAPDYQQGRFKRSLSAFGFGSGSGANPLSRNAANNYAAYTLLTRMVITAVAAEAIRRAITGKFSQNLISAVQNDIFDPNFPTPWKNTSAGGTKESETAHLPATNLSDIYRLIQDPTHFVISHTPALLSDYTGFAANQDYFGNKLSQTNNPIEKLLKVGQNDLPIPVVQAQKLLKGSVAPGNALLNELGARVSLNPNDPTALYFNARDKALQGVTDPKVQAAYAALQAVSTLDPNDPRRRQIEYTTYQAFPQLFQVNKQAAIAQAGGDLSKVDPLFTSPNSQKYLEYEQLNSTVPGSAEEKQYLKNHPEVLQLIKDRAAFYQANPIAQNPNAPAFVASPVPSAYVQQQLDAKNYNDPQVQSYLNQHLDYVNQMRAKLGLDPLDQYGNIQGSSRYGSVGSPVSYGLGRNLRREFTYERKTYGKSMGGFNLRGSNAPTSFGNLPFRKLNPTGAIKGSHISFPHATRPMGNAKMISTLAHKGKTYKSHTIASISTGKSYTPKFHKLPLPMKSRAKRFFA